MIKSKPLPAFAAPLAAARKRGMTLTPPLVTVRLHWGRRPSLGFGIVCPTDRDPGGLDWSWVRALEVVLYIKGDSTERVDQAIRAIQSSRPRRLVVVDFLNDRIVNIITPAEVARAA